MQNLVQIESVFSFATRFVTADNRVHPTATCLVTANNRVQDMQTIMRWALLLKMSSKI